MRKIARELSARITIAPTGSLAVPTIKPTEYTICQIDALNAAIQCFYQVVLPRKTRRECEAGELLRRFHGKYTTEILEKIFDLAEKDPQGPWFGQMLARPNRNRLYNCHIFELNALIDNLLGTGDLAWLGRWRRAGNRGMSKGIATLLMYLNSPEQHNVWLPKTHQGLAILSRLVVRYPQNEISPEEYGMFYKRFNEAAIAVRKENGLAPQAMDWFSWFVLEYKMNPSKRALQAYIKGEAK